MEANIIEINITNLKSNIEAIKGYIGPYAKFLAVVKADAYGHGLKEIAPYLDNVDGFGVANIEEALTLRELGISKHILIMGDIFPSDIKEIVHFDIIPSVSNIESARLISKEGTREDKIVSIHIKVDTGMGRFGFMPEELVKSIDEILSLPNLKLEGIFSHFSTAGVDKNYVDIQFKRFIELISILERKRVFFSIRHIANSPATLLYPYTAMDMVRVGIAMYGINPNDISAPVNLIPVMSLKSKILTIRDIPKDWSVGYDRTFISNREIRIGIIPIGYGDGIPFQLSNNGYVLIRGKRAPIIGRICMDYTIIDLTNIPEVGVGDEVILIGKQGEDTISVRKIADWCRVIPYTIVTSLKGRIKRKLIVEPPEDVQLRSKTLKSMV
jgi:alanine racemase